MKVEQPLHVSDSYAAMNKHLLLAALAAVILGALSWVGLRAFRCKKAYTAACALLTHPAPVTLTPAEEFQGQKLDLGYATLTLPTESIDSIKLYGEGWAVDTSFDAVRLLTIRPVQTDPGVFDEHFKQDGESILHDADATFARLDLIRKQPQADRLMIDLFRDYRWRVFALNAQPRSFLDLLLSSGSDRALYEIKLMASANRFARLGVALLETDATKAVIYLGEPKEPGVVYANVWSKNGKISQAIKLSSESWKTSQDAMHRILSTFRYALDEVPEEEEVKKLVAATIREHEKYMPRTDEQP